MHSTVPARWLLLFLFLWINGRQTWNCVCPVWHRPLSAEIWCSVPEAAGDAGFGFDLWRQSWICVFALHVASTCHILSRCVVRGYFFTSRKINSNFSLSIENSASTKWHLNKFCAVRICESSLWVGLPSAKVAVAWSGHMALIWDPSVSVSLSKARKTPRVPPVSHPVSVTAALRISPLFTVSPDLKYALSEGLVCAYFLPPLTVRCFKMISTLNTKFITFVLKTM